MFKKLTETVSERVNERISNPFVFAFITSLIFFHWKQIVILIFSQNGVEDRITYLEHCYNQESWEIVIYSLLIALAYNLLPIHIITIIERLNLFIKKKRVDQDIKYQQVVINQKELVPWNDERKEYIEKIKVLNEELSILKSEINIRDTELLGLTHSVENLTAEINQLVKEQSTSVGLTELELGILKSLFEFPKSAKEIRSWLKNKNILFDASKPIGSSLGRLRELNLVNRNVAYTPQKYNLTNKGRAVL